MNRRTLLQSAAVGAAVGLAGCIDGVREHFGLQGVIPLEIHNESDRTHNVQLEAYEPTTDRQSYDQSYSVTPGETIGAPNLDKTNQSFRVTRIEDEEKVDVTVETVTEDTTLVLVWLYNDEIVIEPQDGENAGNETTSSDADTDGNQTSETDGNETDDADD
ncbi:hypothetical protein GS429_08745 [Natronorubrum sp. JWXQ-INN-674]|uniref:Uncharacterized protein n=1 Tax=Natronorubrum halalkaliphilum TaxID=2691917 RepID=A0A6B0VM34_9EURY|nr:hypothetical protein [Natronorubrum halalkaliphilum]MXV62147.1 hypothetical protein [Natronorubrum halalkaliphilum]